MYILTLSSGLVAVFLAMKFTELFALPITCGEVGTHFAAIDKTLIRTRSITGIGIGSGRQKKCSAYYQRPGTWPP
ncbi:hypothetical protein K438DRAFT_1837641 [Mycena galopus ATCC 62051]|nr:hypothetical protein K438DRAFT_1837641 [Mycena galopus ATCC 62051]